MRAGAKLRSQRQVAGGAHAREHPHVLPAAGDLADARAQREGVRGHVSGTRLGGVMGSRGNARGVGKFWVAVEGNLGRRRWGETEGAPLGLARLRRYSGSRTTSCRMLVAPK